MIDAVVFLPINVFCGAGVPACLLILRKQRPVERRDQVLLIYAARHFRDLSAQNELRPQDVMRMLVHYHAYGDAARASALVAEHSDRIHHEIDRREADEVPRIEAEFQPHADKLATLDATIQQARATKLSAETKRERANAAAAVRDLLSQREKVATRVAERDQRIAEARRSAEADRNDVMIVGEDLTALYADPRELLKHVRVVDLDEVVDNEFNLNVPRYVDTFEPEPRQAVQEALASLAEARAAAEEAEADLGRLLREVGYAN